MSQIIPYLAPGALTNTQSDVTDLQSLSGLPDNSVNLGTFTGSTIPDNQTTKQALQALETEVEDRLPDFVSWRTGLAGAYYFDGVNDTVARAGWTPDNANCTVVLACKFSSPSSLQGLFSTADYTGDNRIRLSVESGGIIKGGMGATVGQVQSSGITDNEWHVVALTGDGTNIKLYIDGELVDSDTYTPRSSVGSTGYFIGSVGGVSSWFRGHIDRVVIFNRALTASEVALVSRGQSIGFSDRGATGSASYTSDFSAGVDSWTVIGGTSGAGTASQDGIGGENDTLQFTSDTSTGGHYQNKSSLVSAGKRYRVTGKVYIPSANSNLDGFLLQFGGTPTWIDTQPSSTGVTDTWIDVEAEFVAGGAGSLFLYYTDGGSTSFTGVGTDVAYSKDWVVTPIGEVLSLLPSGAAPTVCADQSGNGYNGSVTSATLINPMPLHADAFVSFTNLPTSSAGLATGRVWNDSGTLKIV